LKIYTKGGDKGSTSLLGGRRVPKYHLKIEAYGPVDELMAFVAVVMDSYQNDYYRDFLSWVLDRLMTISSILASDCDDCPDQLPQLTVSDIQKLELEIDKMEEKLTPLRTFILPGGNITASYCHVARTITRRAERIIVRLNEEFSTDELVIKYLNRLSDFFFVLSRLIISDLQLKENVWKPQL
jgi:cob(I)alamin adenosyltransferase